MAQETKAWLPDKGIRSKVFGQRHNDRGTYANPVAAYILDTTTPPPTVSP